MEELKNLLFFKSIVAKRTIFHRLVDTQTELYFNMCGVVVTTPSLLTWESQVQAFVGLVFKVLK